MSELKAGTWVVKGTDKSQTGAKFEQDYEFKLQEEASHYEMANGAHATYNLTVYGTHEGHLYPLCPGRWKAKSRKIIFVLEWYDTIYIYKGTCDTTHHKISGIWHAASPQLKHDPGHCGTFLYQYETKTDDTEVDVGFLHRDQTGVHVRPQFKFGIKMANWEALMGIGDLQDGLEIGMGASVFTTIRREGSSWVEVVKSVKLKSKQDVINCPGLKQLFEIIQEINRLEALIFEKTGINPSVDGVYFIIDAKIHTGASVGVKVQLGWEDTDGYHMIGVCGEIMALVSAKVSVFTGYNPTEDKYKIIVGASNVGLTIIIQDAPKQPGQALHVGNSLKQPLNPSSDMNHMITPTFVLCESLTHERMKALSDHRVLYWLPFLNVIALLRGCWISCDSEYQRWRKENQEEFTRFMVHTVLSVIFQILLILWFVGLGERISGLAWISFLLLFPLSCCCWVCVN
eukprot:964135_1